MATYKADELVFPTQWASGDKPSKGVPMSKVVDELTSIESAQPYDPSLLFWEAAGIPDETFHVCLNEAIRQLDEKFDEENHGVFGSLATINGGRFFKIYCMWATRKRLAEALKGVDDVEPEDIPKR